MDIQKINWKVCVTGEVPGPDVFFKVFNKWIPESPEVFIDVADYKHVFNGPLTLLAGHYVDYVWDKGLGQYGLLYNRKQPLEGDNETKIEKTFLDVLGACQRLESDSEFKGQFKFASKKLVFTVNDRALVPNSSQSFEAVLPLLKKGMEKGLGESKASFKHLDLPQERFSVEITLDKPLSFASVLNPA